MNIYDEYRELVSEIQSRLDRSHSGQGAPPRKDQWDRFNELYNLTKDPRDPLYIELWRREDAPTEENSNGETGS